MRVTPGKHRPPQGWTVDGSGAPEINYWDGYAVIEVDSTIFSGSCRLEDRFLLLSDILKDAENGALMVHSAGKTQLFFHRL
jgi:hypothetical protein